MASPDTLSSFSDVKYAYVLHGDVRPALGDLQEYAAAPTYANQERIRTRPDTNATCGQMLKQYLSFQIYRNGIQL